MKLFKFISNILNYNKHKQKETNMATANMALGKLKSYSIYKDAYSPALSGLMVSDKIVETAIENLEMEGTYAVVRWDGDTDKFYLLTTLSRPAVSACREFYGYLKGYIQAKDLRVEWDGKDLIYNVKLPAEVENGIIARSNQVLCLAFILQESN